MYDGRGEEKNNHGDHAALSSAANDRELRALVGLPHERRCDESIDVRAGRELRREASAGLDRRAYACRRRLTRFRDVEAPFERQAVAQRGHELIEEPAFSCRERLVAKCADPREQARALAHEDAELCVVRIVLAENLVRTHGAERDGFYDHCAISLFRLRAAQVVTGKGIAGRGEGVIDVVNHTTRQMAMHERTAKLFALFGNP